MPSWLADGVDNEGTPSPIPTPPTLVTRVVTGSLKHDSCSDTIWQHKRLNCPSGFTAISCTHRLSGGGNLDDHGDGDRHTCEVKSSHCHIACRESSCPNIFGCTGDHCECGVSGSCTCRGYE